MIKEERNELETLIQTIASTCDTAYERLEELAKQRPRLDLSDTGLPADEVRTHLAIAPLGSRTRWRVESANASMPTFRS